jgi:hypothetical protein
MANMELDDVAGASRQSERLANLARELTELRPQFDAVQDPQAREEVGWIALQLGKSLVSNAGKSRELREAGESIRKLGLWIIEQGRARGVMRLPQCPMQARVAALESIITEREGAR